MAGVRLEWPEISTSEWMTSQPHPSTWKEAFEKDGYVVVRGLINKQEAKIYQDIYDKMLKGEIDTTSHRHDLGNHLQQKQSHENICQIMWPTIFVPGLDQGPIHQRLKVVARAMLGEDMDRDFDMLICKYPHTDTQTPWHQDASYWPDMPDTRSVSFWVALDNATVDNGCMWFIPGCQNAPLRPSKTVTEGVHVRVCHVEENEGFPVELAIGSCTGHHGKTPHFTRGNTTDDIRRAFIVNYRPVDMIKYERDHGFDHGKKGLDTILAGHNTEK